MNPLQQSKTAISILIVEDSKSASDVIGKMVAKKFPEAAVYSADNGIIGIELFKKHTPNIVITDISMPEMNGIQMVIQIQSIKADTKFIVFTAHADVDFFEQLKEIGVHTYLLKPFDLYKLFKAIEKCIEEITHPSDPVVNGQ